METMKLYNGAEIPANGFGVYQVSKEDCKETQSIQSFSGLSTGHLQNTLLVLRNILSS